MPETSHEQCQRALDDWSTQIRGAVSPALGPTETPAEPGTYLDVGQHGRGSPALGQGDVRVAWNRQLQEMARFARGRH